MMGGRCRVGRKGDDRGTKVGCVHGPAPHQEIKHYALHMCTCKLKFPKQKSILGALKGMPLTGHGMCHFDLKMAKLGIYCPNGMTFPSRNNITGIRSYSGWTWVTDVIWKQLGVAS